MMGDELKPCPYCGSTQVKLVEGEECAYVQCLAFSMHRGGFVDGDNNAAYEAIALWNTRASPPATTDVQGVLHVALEIELYGATVGRLEKLGQELRQVGL